MFISQFMMTNVTNKRQPVILPAGNDTRSWFTKFAAIAPVGLALAFGSAVQAANPLTVASSEYRLVGTQVGDQSKAQMAFGSKGGFAVWQDNATDNDGLGISARRFTSISSGSFAAFPVNITGEGDQENPQVAMFPDGGALFVWQSGALGNQHIRGRIINAMGVFEGAEFLISQNLTSTQTDPAPTILPDGSFLVAYSSWAQDGDMNGVFAQRLARNGTKIGSEISVNQTTRFNQRSAAITTLTQGKSLISWVSEGQRSEDSVDIYARFVGLDGNLMGNEFLLNTSKEACANPNLTPLANGGFMAAWSVLHSSETRSDWDVYARSFKSDGTAAMAERVINTYITGSQFSPKLSRIGSKVVSVWTSFGQDGMQEGIYGQVLNQDGSRAGEEIAINTTKASRQVTPAVTTDGQQSIVVAWSSFTGIQSSFDLLAQRYTVEASKVLPAPGTPWATALGVNTISVSWPEVLGVSVGSYSLIVDGKSSTPLNTTNLVISISDATWLPQSTHTFELAYYDQDGNISTYSTQVVAKTWGADLNSDQLPDDWQKDNWGSVWPSAQADEDQDGANNLQEFLAGTNPRNGDSSLKTSLLTTQAGIRLQWSTQPGYVYQVQSTIDLNSWSDAGSPRFSSGATDSVPTSSDADIRYYRVIRLR